MKHHNNSIIVLKTDIPYELCKMAELSPLQPFSDDVTLFSNVLSKEINSDPRTRRYPDVATFAFFCRKSNINQLKKQYSNEDNIRLGRGLVFHVAPSNVPVNFAYSFLTGLLSGNCNIVKVPSKDFEQIDIISEALHKISHMEVHPHVSERIKLVRYDRSDDAVTEKLSGICDIRIIWGGDETISSIRKHQLPPRSFDITFADRYSLCVINADEFVNETNPEKVAEGFYNDTYLFDQNACTSPHLVVWVGKKENVKTAQSAFWVNLHSLVKEKYQVQPVFAVDKITSFYRQAVNNPSIRLEEKEDNFIYRVKLNHLSDDLDQFRCHSGYFAEYHAASLSEIAKIINRKYQTLSYYGFSKSELSDFIHGAKPVGIDRIVPIGRTMDFSLNWDGYDLIETCARYVTIVKQ